MISVIFQVVKGHHRREARNTLRALRQKVLMRLDPRKTCAADGFMWEKPLTVFPCRRMSRNESSESAKGGNVSCFGHELLSFGIPRVQKHDTFSGTNLEFELKILGVSEDEPFVTPFRDYFAFV